ncbi:PPE family protein [Mycobacterium sp.]|uniref:PPE family protein n=1 Tax=Mycobacterium sp. TaxID=1785 RepID=UPI0031D7BA08
MDFGAFPPEVNSARMYAGPGSGPMLAAASAWNALAAELRSTAAGYQSVISGLTSEGWRGPASASMAAAAAPYTAWLSTTATQAEQTAQQANAAAAAYEAAFAATVPPAVIAANRSLLASLVATNVLGQNTPAIAATEAHYGEMWAQDAAAMFGYAASSAAAAKVTPLTAPPQTTTAAGPANQGAAVAQTTAAAAGSHAQTLSQLLAQIPNALQSMASPTSSAHSGLGGLLEGLDGTTKSVNGLAGVLNFLDGADGSAFGTFLSGGVGNGLLSGGPILGTQTTMNTLADLTVVGSALQGGGGGGGIGAILSGKFSPGTGGVLASAFGPDALAPMAATPAGMGVTLGAGAAPAAPAAMSAGIGRATLVGAMSVPPSWAAPAPPMTPVAAASSSHGFATVPASAMPGMPGMPMSGTGGRGFGFAAPRYGFKPTVMARPVVAG